MTMLDLRAALKQCPVVAILRGVRPDEIDDIGDALVEAGIAIIEVPLNSPEPFASIKRLAARHGEHALIGAGTVLIPAEIARVVDAGGQLVVAPNFNADVVRAAKDEELEALPGVMTPSEGLAALKAGADGLKLFPAEILPPSVFKAWRAVFPPDCLLLAVGGVGTDNLRTYRDAGASGFGIGSALYQPGRSAAQIGVAARALVAAANT
jgi:2-dehydro-3-deoxyphosphogalactonate aldolase